LHSDKPLAEVQSVVQRHDDAIEENDVTKEMELDRRVCLKATNEKGLDLINEVDLTELCQDRQMGSTFRETERCRERQ